MQINISNMFEISMIELEHLGKPYLISKSNSRNTYNVFPLCWEDNELKREVSSLQEALNAIIEIGSILCTEPAKCGPVNVDADGREVT